MPNYLTRNLKQTATVFSRGTLDGYGGYSYTKTTVNCRWEDKQVLFTDKSGQERTSRAIVYVDTDVSLGDFMLLGTSTSATPPDGAYEVKSFNKSPDLKGRLFERKVVV